jgi:polysaccharide export outer membrane protein
MYTQQITDAASRRDLEKRAYCEYFSRRAVEVCRKFSRSEASPMRVVKARLRNRAFVKTSEVPLALDFLESRGVFPGSIRVTDWRRGTKTARCLHKCRATQAVDSETKEMCKMPQQHATNLSRIVHIAFLEIVLIGGFATLRAIAGDNVPAKTEAPADYRLGAEDVIDVFVWKEPDLSATVTVRPDGNISLPLAGELGANGKTAGELQQEISQKLQQYLSQPVVSVMVKQINSMKISVLGEVRKPDVYKIKNRVTLLDAIAMAGGFTDLAKPNKVVILRNTPSGVQRFMINVKQAVGEAKGGPFYLQSLDTVYVE